MNRRETAMDTPVPFAAPPLKAASRLDGARPSLAAAQPRKWSRTFREAFCESYRCAPDRFEKALFWRSLHRYSVPLAALVYWVKPDFFREDFEAIRELGGARDAESFNHDVNLFYARNLRHGGFLRRALDLRISGKRLIQIRNRVVRESGAQD